MRAEIKRLVGEVSLGIVLYDVLLLILAAVLRMKSDVFWGLIAGGLAAILLFVHMAMTSERTLDLKAEEPARKRATMNAMLRLLLMLLLMLVTMKVQWLNTVALVVGMLGLKAGAYLQPLIHKAAGKRA